MAGGEVEAGGPHEREEADRQAGAGRQAHEGGGRADEERLEAHGTEHLGPRRADRPQQRGLPRPLGEDHGERVVDAEGRDEQGHAGEHQEEDLEEVEEVVADRSDLLVGQLRSGDHVGVVVEDGPNSRGQLVGSDAVGPPDEHLVHLRGISGEVLLGVGRVHRGVGGATEGVLPVEGHEAHDLHLERLRDADEDGVAHLDVTVVGGSSVEDDLAGRLGGPAGGQLVGGDRLVVDPRPAERRRPVAPDRLAVGAHHLDRAGDQRLGVGHAVDRADVVEDRRVERRALLEVVAADLRGAPDHHVGAGVGRREDVVEGGAERVAQHQRPGEERHADEHGGAGAEQPSGVGADGPPYECEHVRPPVVPPSAA